MIEVMQDVPDHVVGLSASGQVTTSDYESVVIPAIEDALKSHSQIRLIYHLGPDFTGFTPGAMWDDTKLGFSQLKAWEKIAVVTDHAWITNMVWIFSLAIPFPIKVFPNDEFEQGMQWLVAP